MAAGNMWQGQSLWRAWHNFSGDQMMAGWCHIDHSSHAWPCLHDPPHKCDFSDVENNGVNGAVVEWYEGSVERLAGWQLSLACGLFVPLTCLSSFFFIYLSTGCWQWCVLTGELLPECFPPCSHTYKQWPWSLIGTELSPTASITFSFCLLAQNLIIRLDILTAWSQKSNGWARIHMLLGLYWHIFPLDSCPSDAIFKASGLDPTIGESTPCTLWLSMATN